MSGSRYFNFREGDRSEYLATYFFSAFGLVTPVPRQEDIGFDLVCSIADQELGRLTFNHQFLVSVKSVSTPNIELEPTKSEDGTLPHLSWLFRQELPLLLAVIDKDAQSLRVYSTLPIWFIYFENPDCGALNLVPRLDAANTADVGRPIKGPELASLPGAFTYSVDLGHPILRLTVADLSAPDRIRVAKRHLRAAVNYGRLTSLQVQLGVPYFYWFARTSADGALPTPAFFANQLPDIKEAQEYVYSRIAPTLISLAMLYKDRHDATNLAAVMQLLSACPASEIPEPVRQHLPPIKAP